MTNREIVTEAMVSGAQVRVVAGGHVGIGHVERVLHGGFEFIERVADGRIKRIVWWVNLDFVDEFV
jgi:hypothetical protein